MDQGPPSGSADTVERLLREASVAYKLAGFEEDWQREEGGIRTTLAELVEQLDGVFTLESAIGVGGTGVALLVRDERLGKFGEDPVYSVVKIPRPYFEAVIAQESERLIGLRHENLVRIQMSGTTLERGTPFFVMEAVEGATDADQWLLTHPHLSELLRILECALRGVDNLHSKNIAHLDLKPSNIFVNPESVIVADLGFAKRVGVEGVTSRVGRTPGYYHPDYDTVIREIQQAGGSQYPREDLRTAWDIYSLGITLLVLLRVIESQGVDSTDYSFRYLKLMAYRMLGAQARDAVSLTRGVKVAGVDGRLVPPLVEDRYLGLNQTAFGILAYQTVSEILDDVDKLTGRLDLLRNVPELQEFPRDVIQAASHGSAPFSDRIAHLVSLPQVHRLAKVDQLGLVRLVYPTATHSRLEHSLGTLAMAARFTRALYNDPVSPLFRQFMNETDIEVLLAVCLLHDIGHYPLAHDLEEVDGAFKHETRTIALISGPEVVEAFSSGYWSLGVHERVLSVLTDGDGSTRPVQDMLIRAVIDGPVDADKVDYLLRDSENLRLPYGQGVDVPKLLQSLTVIVKSGTTAKDKDKVFARIGISDKGRIAAESVAFARYSLYGSVYWHRTHRTLKAMLNRLGFEALRCYAASLAPASRAKSVANFERDLATFLDDGAGTTPPLTPAESLSQIETGRYFDARTEQVVAWLVQQVRRPMWKPSTTNRGVSEAADSFEKLASDLHRGGSTTVSA
jgi:HD superfamily phosphohydrolase